MQNIHRRILDRITMIEELILRETDDIKSYGLVCRKEELLRLGNELMLDEWMKQT